VEANSVTNNDRGIHSEVGPNLIVKNTAAGNTLVPYYLTMFDKRGFVVTEPDDAGPWGNFDF
ncbi:MAG: hypothetical protein ACYTEX_19030, partial [Planctomycetota bacterium]